MNLLFTPKAWAEFQFWIDTDKRILTKILSLIEDSSRAPFSSIGKPEPLTGQLARHWSRRITGEHRLVYRVEGSGDAQLVIVQCRYHY